MAQDVDHHPAVLAAVDDMLLQPAGRIPFDAVLADLLRVMFRDRRLFPQMFQGQEMPVIEGVLRVQLWDQQLGVIAVIAHLGILHPGGAVQADALALAVLQVHRSHHGEAGL